MSGGWGKVPDELIEAIEKFLEDAKDKETAREAFWDLCRTDLRLALRDKNQDYLQLAVAAANRDPQAMAELVSIDKAYDAAMRPAYERLVTVFIGEQWLDSVGDITVHLANHVVHAAVVARIARRDDLDAVYLRFATLAHVVDARAKVLGIEDEF